nr:hypothetical transcript [Hymenolepis microstoma]
MSNSVESLDENRKNTPNLVTYLSVTFMLFVGPEQTSDPEEVPIEPVDNTTDELEREVAYAHFVTGYYRTME